MSLPPGGSGTKQLTKLAQECRAAEQRHRRAVEQETRCREALDRLRERLLLLLRGLPAEYAHAVVRIGSAPAGLVVFHVGDEVFHLEPYV